MWIVGFTGVGRSQMALQTGALAAGSWWLVAGGWWLGLALCGLRYEASVAATVTAYLTERTPLRGEGNLVK